MFSATKQRIEKQPVQETVAPRKAPWFGFLMRVVAWQILAFFVVELSLSLAGLGEEEMFKLDPVLGFKHMSNKKVTWRSEGFATSYFNEDGMREPGLAVAKPAGTYRVALLGDSLAESLQVPIEQSFGYQIEKQLTRDLKRPVQVLDFGVSGYSTVQEYLQLKKQVLKYKPDLILLCYNSRDCFENWSPPDEVLTNVRPAALHLPGRKLVVDTSPVTQWMKTPRAKFLKQVEFLRQNSRLWGLYSAAELDWSLHNEAYKKLIFFATKPGKAIRQSTNELNAYANELLAKLGNGKNATAITASSSSAATSSTASSTAVASTSNNNAASATVKTAATVSANTATTSTTKTAATVSANTPALLSSDTAEEAVRSGRDARAPGASIDTARASGRRGDAVRRPETAQSVVETQKPQSSPAAQAGRLTYQQLIVRTLGSLISEMKDTSNNHGAQFAVVALPVRSALSVRKGMETTFNDFDFNDEIKMLQGICSEKKVDFINIHEQAKSLSAKEKDELFFLVHLTPDGHSFVARHLEPVLEPYVSSSVAKHLEPGLDPYMRSGHHPGSAGVPPAYGGRP